VLSIPLGHVSLFTMVLPTQTLFFFIFIHNYLWKHTRSHTLTRTHTHSHALTRAHIHSNTLTGTSMLRPKPYSRRGEIWLCVCEREAWDGASAYAASCWSKIKVPDTVSSTACVWCDGVRLQFLKLVCSKLWKGSYSKNVEVFGHSLV